MKWFRLYHEIVDDPKVHAMNDKCFRVFINLLCIASNSGVTPEYPSSNPEVRGEIKMSTGEVAWRMRIHHHTVEAALKKLTELNIISTNGKKIKFLNWNKRQRESDSSALRTQKWREKKEIDVTSPRRDSDALETESETETDKETNKQGGKDRAEENTKTKKLDFSQLEKNTDRICKTLTGYFKNFNVYAWRQEQVNKQQHPEAIKECLDLLWKYRGGIKKTPRAYLTHIMKIKSQNAFEREEIAAHEKRKEEGYDETFFRR